MSIQQSSLLLRPRAGSGGKVYWDAQWRYRIASEERWRFKKQRLGLAWLEPDDDGGWRKRKGRCRDGWLDERAANVAAVAAMKSYAEYLATSEERARRERELGMTVRGLAREWLTWLEEVKRAKPSTLRDYRTLLREPGERHKRGDGTSAGRLMRAFGDRPAMSVQTSEIDKFLRSLDAEGFTPRNVNKYRQVLHSIYAYGLRRELIEMPRNPVTGTDKRPEPPPERLDYYEVEEVEALARACERGAHRGTSYVSDAEREARVVEDRQDADAFRVLFYTGIRLGELLALRLGDVHFADRFLVVRRNLSARVETLPKNGRIRFVPLSDPALAALSRLAARNDFVSDQDYLLVNRWGRRLDDSALRRRYHRACKAAGLRRLKLHGLRHAAGSIVGRTSHAVFTRDFLGHSRLTTTDRYVGAKYLPEDIGRLNLAFRLPSPATDSEAAPAVD